MPRTVPALLAACLAAGLPLSAQQVPPPAAKAAPPDTAITHELDGQWRGVMTVPTGQQQLVLRVRQVARYRYDAALDLPPLFDSVSLRGFAHWRDSVRFVFSMPTIDASFSGRVAGEEIEGRWRQVGESVPVRLHRLSLHPERRRPQDRFGPAPFAEIDVSYDGGDPGVRLAGTLALPPGPGPHPGVLFLSGSGPHDRDGTMFGHKHFQVLSDYLVSRGIAVLRVDDRGVRASTGDLRSAGVPELTRDALAGVAFLRARPEIRQDAIGLLGHSEGALVAPLAAVASPGVAFLVLLATPGLPMREFAARNVRGIVAAEGADPALAAAQADMNRRALEVLARHLDDTTTLGALLRITHAYLARPPYGSFTPEKRAEIAGTMVSAYMAPRNRFLARYDPAATFRRVRVPVLALNGEKDVQVEARPNLAAIAAALRAGGNPRFVTRELPGLNHLFQHAATGAMSEYGIIEETFAPEAMALIGDWIVGVVKRR